LSWLDKWPGHQATSLLSNILTFTTGVLVEIHLARNVALADNYESWFLFLLALAGVNVAGMTLRRTTDYQYQQIKNQATPPVQTGGPTTVVAPAPAEDPDMKKPGQP
jgi:hypothetical protein